MDKLKIKINKDMNVLDFWANQNFLYGYSLKLLRQKDARINGIKNRTSKSYFCYIKLFCSFF